MSEAKLPEPDVWAIGSLDGREEIHAYSAEAMHAFRAEGVALERERVAALCKVREKRFLAAFTQTNDVEDQWAAMEFESLAAAIREGDSHE